MYHQHTELHSFFHFDCQIAIACSFLSWAAAFPPMSSHTVRPAVRMEACASFLSSRTQRCSKCESEVSARSGNRLRPSLIIISKSAPRTRTCPLDLITRMCHPFCDRGHMSAFLLWQEFRLIWEFHYANRGPAKITDWITQMATSILFVCGYGMSRSWGKQPLYEVTDR